MRCDTGPVHRPPGPPGHRADAQPAGRSSQALFKGYADIGNDSPFAPVFPSTNTSVAQRDAEHRQGQVAAVRGRARLRLQHPAVHRELPGDPGVRPDRGAERPADRGEHQPEGGELDAYYGKAIFGNSDWLDATMSLVDYGHRSVPNVFLTAPLRRPAKTGTALERGALRELRLRQLVAQYVAASTCPRQQSIAGPDRDAAARPDPDHLRLLLQLPVRYGEERDRRVPDRYRAPVPVQRDEELGLA